MNMFCTIMLLLAMLPQSDTWYKLEWISAIPIDLKTIEVELTSGYVQAIYVYEGETRGGVIIGNDLECFRVTFRAVTVTKVPFTVVRWWEAECYRYYFPVVGR